MIDIDFEEWQKEYHDKCKDALTINSILIEELRELGICYNPNHFKNDYGFVKNDGKNEQVKLEKDDKEYSIKQSLLDSKSDDSDKTCEVVLFEDEI